MSVLPPTRDDRAIWDLWTTSYHLPTVTVADEVGTFAALSGQSLDTAQLAEVLLVDARALHIHLGVLAGLGLVERREGRWQATAAARTWLHPQAQGYYGPLLHRHRVRDPLHMQLLATLRTGQKPDSHHSAVNEWERGEMPAGLAAMITAYMNAHSRAAALAVAEQPLFAAIGSVLDVGGGSAIFSIALARAQAGLAATVMEIPAICTEADAYIAAAGVAAQVRTQAVNMFTEAWPAGYDAHFLSNILHDWSDATCLLLAHKSFAALPAGGRILLHEMLMDDDGCGPLTTACFSLLMLLGTRGRQYTFAELRGFLEAAGFVDVSAQTTGGGYYSLVSARKP
jgi:acetylserotonin N-methyltransferase